MNPSLPTVKLGFHCTSFGFAGSQQHRLSMLTWKTRTEMDDLGVRFTLRLSMVLDKTIAGERKPFTTLKNHQMRNKSSIIAKYILGWHPVITAYFTQILCRNLLSFQPQVSRPEANFSIDSSSKSPFLAFLNTWWSFGQTWSANSNQWLVGYLSLKLVVFEKGHCIANPNFHYLWANHSKMTIHSHCLISPIWAIYGSFMIPLLHTWWTCQIMPPLLKGSSFDLVHFSTLSTEHIFLRNSEVGTLAESARHLAQPVIECWLDNLIGLYAEVYLWTPDWVNFFFAIGAPKKCPWYSKQV